MSPIALRPSRRQPLAACAVLWLLAIVLPLQGLAGLLAQVAGPAHVHTSAAVVALVDFRRAGGLSSEERQAAIEARHGHRHDGEASARHPHAFDDASVRYVDGSRFGDASAHDIGATGDAVAAFLPLWLATPFWLLSDISHWRREAPAWNATAAERDRVDRPPRSFLR